jgi:hypothetical protein
VTLFGARPCPATRGRLLTVKLPAPIRGGQGLPAWCWFRDFHTRRLQNGDVEQPQSDRVSEPPAAGWDAAAVRAHRDLARTALEWQRNRYEAFERKAVGVLGFVGVIGALLFTLLDPISKVRGVPRIGAKGILVAVAVAIVAAAIAAVAAQFTRKVAAPFPLNQVRDEWAAFKACQDKEEGFVMATETEMLLGGPDYPLRAISDDAALRGRWFKAAAICLGLAVALLAALLALLVVVRR